MLGQSLRAHVAYDSNDVAWPSIDQHFLADGVLVRPEELCRGGVDDERSVGLVGPTEVTPAHQTDA